jgi:glycosyltransferase involved in cell wall biosynthesis
MERRIKLFVDAHVFDGIPQGSVSYLKGLYSQMIRDERFEIYVGSSDRDLVAKLLNGSQFVHIKYLSRNKYLRLLWIIPRALRRYEIDYAHFQYISPFLKPCKYIITIHDLLFIDFKSQFPLLYRIKNGILFYISAKKADLLLTVSEYSKNAICTHFNIIGEKIHLIPNGISTISDEPLELDCLKGKRFILCVSRIEPRKNQALLVRTWRTLELFKSGINLVLVGPLGISDTKLEHEIERLSDVERLSFYWLKETQPAQLKWLYMNCGLFVYPSLAEGFGIPPLEAVLYGANVITSRTTAMAEFEFLDPFRFDPENEEEFKQKLLFGLENSLDLKKTGGIIKSNYSWEKISSEFGDIILKSDFDRFS